MDLIPLAGLALLDGLSVGTLVIPLVLVVRRGRVDWGPLSIYFLTVLSWYFLLGVALLMGLDAATGALDSFLASDLGSWITVIAGALLLAYGVLAPDPAKREGSRPDVPAPTAWAMIALATGAAVAEAATMVPYLAAIGLMASLDLGFLTRLILLACYCVLMILPALVLLAVASIVGCAMMPRLERLLPKLEREAKITLLWLAALGGIWLMSSGAVALWT